MELAFKDIITITISTISLLILLYNLWDSKRKKLNIYIGSDYEVRDEILMHLLTFLVINKSSRPVPIYDTQFYLQYPFTPKWRYPFGKKHSALERVSFGSTEGHLYDQSIIPDKAYKIRLEAYEVYNNGLGSKAVTIPSAIAIELIDLDGKAYRKTFRLNQLNHEDNAKLKPKEFCFPSYYFKEEGKMRKERQKQKRKIERSAKLLST